MANPEHLKILHHGVEVWNKWRMDNRRISFSLNGADLSGLVLRYFDLSSIDLSEAKLNETNLVEANLIGANLSNADLSKADLNSASLSFAIFEGANLSQTDLCFADLSSASLDYANLTDSYIGHTKFADNDLSETIGLETVHHQTPSSIGIDTLQKSESNIPEAFLRGCGLSDWEIEHAKLYKPDLSNEEINGIQYRIHNLRVSKAFQIKPLFISYSHNNKDFVDTIEKLLIQEGIRFWRDIHDAKAGRFETQIDKAINLQDVVLLVLSEHSTKSDWVEHEVRTAREKERKSGIDTLCPIALDDSWKTCRWPARLREQIMEYNILDFSNWQDDKEFQKMFSKLLEGLNLFYK
jgi:uncharacterized protein YjbI with pentapeptide repeats